MGGGGGPSLGLNEARANLATIWQRTKKPALGRLVDVANLLI
jgi:hypothetical protein